MVVDTQALQHKQRCSHTAQTQLSAQILLEKFFDQFNTLLRLLHIEQSFISNGFNQLTHIFDFSNFRAKVHNKY